MRHISHLFDSSPRCRDAEIAIALEVKQLAGAGFCFHCTITLNPVKLVGIDRQTRRCEYESGPAARQRQKKGSGGTASLMELDFSGDDEKSPPKRIFTLSGSAFESG